MLEIDDGTGFAQASLTGTLILGHEEKIELSTVN